MTDDFKPESHDPNGAAFEKVEKRVGVPLSYVAEKLRSAMEILQASIGRQKPAEESDAIDSMRAAFIQTLTSYLALNNMLAGTRDSSLPDRLLALSKAAFQEWLDRIDLGGSVSD